MSDSGYLSKLKDATLESLRKLKAKKDSSNQLEADMWCHFGLATISGLRKGNTWPLKAQVKRNFHYKILITCINDIAVIILWNDKSDNLLDTL